MKKIVVLASLPVIALSSCGKEDNQKKEIVNNTAVNTQTENKAVQETAPLNENISSWTTNESWLTIKEFKLTYDLPNGKPLNFNWSLEIENWVIKKVNFPEYDLENAKTYEVKFAKKIQSDLVWKTLKWLQYDGITWASLTTKAFNEYLNTINK